MSRPKKENLDYFPFDVDFFSDKKIKILKAKFGADGIAVYLYILCEIYHNGYFAEYDEDFVLMLSDFFNFSESKTRQILAYLLNRSLLVSILVESVTVITARSVQRRYQEAKKWAKRDIFVNERIWLLQKEETEPFIKMHPVDSFSQKNKDISEKNDNKSEKNRTKESKVKESKEESMSSCDDAPVLPYQDVMDLFNQICQSLPKAKELTDKRKRQIKTIFQRFKPDFKEVFERVEKSDFLTGRNGKWNGCSFDWILNPSNFVKVIEGNYDNKEEHHADNQRNPDEQAPKGGRYGTYL